MTAEHRSTAWGDQGLGAALFAELDDIGAVVWDAAGDLLLVNAAARRMLSHRGGARRIDELGNPYLRDAVTDLLASAREEGRAEGEIAPGAAGAGSALRLRLRRCGPGVPGTPAWLLLIRDLPVSERAREREQLRLFERMLSATTDGISFVDRNHIYRAVNAFYLRLFELEEGDIVGRRVEEILGAEAYRSLVRPRLDAALAGETVRYEAEFIFPVKGARRIELTYAPYCPAGGEVSGVVVTVHDVTERYLAEQALRESESRHKQIAELTSDWVYSYSLRGDGTAKLDWISGALERVTGHRSEDITVGYWMSLVHPEDRSRVQEMLQQILDADAAPTPASLTLEYRLRRAGGDYIWVEDTAKLSWDETEGRIVRSTGAARDITARKAAAEALRESEQRFYTLFETMAQGVVYHRGDGALIDANPAAARILGRCVDEIVGRTSMDPDWRAVRADDGSHLPGEEHPAMVALRTGRPVLGFVMGVYNPVRDGLVWIQVDAVPRLAPGDDRPREVYTVFADITERRASEEALRESEKRYRSLFENALDAIFVLDDEAVIVDANPAACRLFRYEREELMGRRTSELVTAARCPDPLGFSRGLLEPAWQRANLDAVAGDGTRLEVNVRVAADVRPGLHLAVVRDLTEERRLQRALIRAQKMEALGQLTGGIAHDFNNILHGILGLAELAQERFGHIDRKLDECLRVIRSSGERGRDLVRQLLVFARGDSREDAAPMDLTRLVRDSLEMLRPAMPSSVLIETGFEEGLPPVVMTPVHLQQLVMNICVNARDAMAGKGTLTVKVRRASLGGRECDICHVLLDGEWIEIAMADTGPGVPEEELERIFEPFYSTKEVGVGAGMGLAVVKGILQTYGGHLFVENREEGGACFHLLFPPAAVPVETDETEEPEPIRDLSGRDLGVLVVDDEPAVLFFMRELLERYGYRVSTFANGEEALRRFRESPRDFDVLVTDLTMPVLTGLDLAEEVRAVRPDLPVVIVSGYGEAMDRLGCERLHIDARLHKPLAGADLLRILQRLVG